MNYSHCSGQNSTSAALQVEEPLYSFFIANIAANGCLCYSTIMMNTVTIYALQKTSSLPKPLRTLLLNLAVSDLGVGLLGQPLYVAHLVIKLRCTLLSRATYITFAIVWNLLYLTSVFGIMVLNADRFVAIQTPLRYEELVTHKRAITVVITIWLFCAIFVSFVVLALLQNILVIIFDIIILVALVATTLSSIKIYLTARRQGIQIQAQIRHARPNEELMHNAVQRKSAQTTLWIYLVFWFCYLPNVVVSIVHGINPSQNTIKEALFTFSATLVFLNSSLNPAIYCWKMRHIRHTVMDILMGILRNILPR